MSESKTVTVSATEWAELIAQAEKRGRVQALRDWAAQLDEAPFHRVVQGDMARWVRGRADAEEGDDEPYCDDGRTCACNPKADT